MPSIRIIYTVPCTIVCVVATYNVIKLCIHTQIFFASNMRSEAGTLIAALHEAFLDTITAEAVKAFGQYDTCIGAMIQTD